MGNKTSNQKGTLADITSQSLGSSGNILLRQKSQTLPRAYGFDWTIDRHRITRTYLVFGVTRIWENAFDIRVPDDIVLTIFLFYYLAHRERFECLKALEPDKQIISQQGGDDIDNRKTCIKYGTLIIDSSLYTTKHVWVFRILAKNCCSIAIGIVDTHTNVFKYLYRSDGNIVATIRSTPQTFAKPFTWGDIVCMELDLSKTYGIVRFGVQKEDDYKKYESVTMNVAFNFDVKRETKWKMAVEMDGYEAMVQLLEYFEDDNIDDNEQSNDQDPFEDVY
eukprot:167662_1